MATDSVQLNSKSDSQDLSATDIARAVMTPLASLKLTVFLLALGVLITFIATLEQTRSDVFNVKSRHVRLFEGHFDEAFVEVPFQIFFVKRWFPDYQNVPGSFYIPSGGLLLILMLINLASAHLLRFRLHAKGPKLVLGIVVAGFAAVLTWAIIFNGQNADGFQADPPISWTAMWAMLQIGVLGVAIGSVVMCFSLDSTRKIEKWLLGIVAVVCAVVLGITVFAGKDAFIGNSAMRILWQLSQSTIAALISFVACSILFKRKAGIVLLHLGIAGLMANEIYVTKMNQEFRMTVFEGQTVSHAQDSRSTEMAIIDTSDPEMDQIVTIPGYRLQAENTISNDQLPFDVTCVKYFPSSDLGRATGDSLATEGIGKQAKAVAVPPVAGTDSQQTVDFASAYVEITHKTTGESLGTHLISQHLESGNSDTIEVDGTKYRILLQFKTEFKPYSVKLIDAKRENYIGSNTASSYSSDIVLTDHESQIASEIPIWMNNPLRYSGETFYQSGMDTTSDGREYSVFQIVRNHGWMIPYVCCMFTVIGLMAQFGSTLLGFLKKQNSLSSAKPELATPKPLVPDTQSDNPYSGTKKNKKKHRPSQRKIKRPTTVAPMGFVGRWLPTIIIAGTFAIFGGVSLLMALVGTTKKDGMRLDLLGQIPIAINGRIQPLDSLARNTARQLGKREKVADSEGTKQPAIRWFADTAFSVDGYKDYRLFRIEDKTIIKELDLPLVFDKSPDNSPRKNFVYTLTELDESEDNLRRLMPKNRDTKSWTVFEKRLSGVADKLQMVFGVQLAFGLPEDRQSDDVMVRLEMSSRKMTSPLIPLIVPTDDEDAAWISMMAAENRAWLYDLSKRLNADTTASLTQAILEKEVLPQVREDAIRDRVIAELLSSAEFRKLMGEEAGKGNPQEMARLMKEKWSDIPAEIKSSLVRREAPLVDALLAEQLPMFTNAMESQLIEINGSRGKITGESTELLQRLQAIRSAYVANDTEEFNSNVTAYLDMVASNPPREMSRLKFAAEKFYNHLAPFFLAMVIYLAAFVVATFGWMGGRIGWNRASTSLLLLGLTFQIMGLVTRIVISGRPPITNLYSSVLFVSVAAVILLMVVEKITKLGIGNALAGISGFSALMWAWSMTIVDGDTFTVMVAVLDTQFWLATHVVIISLGYAATFAAGLLGAAFLITSLLTSKMEDKATRRKFSSVIYGVVCFGLFCSFFGTVLGGLWGDDSWGRFWGWDPKENGALMIVLWNAVVLHARWSGMVRERGMAALATLGNVVVLWSWKGVNAMGVGLHAYAGNEDETIRVLLMIAAGHIILALLVIIPIRFWMSYSVEESAKRQKLA